MNIQFLLYFTVVLLGLIKNTKSNHGGHHIQFGTIPSDILTKRCACGTYKLLEMKLQIIGKSKMEFFVYRKTPIGAGYYSKVYHGYSEDLNKCVAIKVVKIWSNAPEKDSSKQLLKEAHVMEELAKSETERIIKMIAFEFKELPEKREHLKNPKSDIPIEIEEITIVMEIADVPLFHRVWDLWLRPKKSTKIRTQFDEDILPYYLKPAKIGERADKRKMIGVKELTDIFKHSLESIDELHKAGVLHLDLKADNFIYVNLTHHRDGRKNDQILKVIDFNVSELFDKTKGEIQREFPSGCWRYYSPEQQYPKKDEHGKAIYKLTPKTDIFNLGLMFYEFLYGKLPYRHANYASDANLHDQKTDSTDEVKKFMANKKLHREIDYAPPPQTNPKSFKKRYGHLVTIIIAILQYDPAQRPKTSGLLKYLKYISGNGGKCSLKVPPNPELKNFEVDQQKGTLLCDEM